MSGRFGGWLIKMALDPGDDGRSRRTRNTERGRTLDGDHSRIPERLSVRRRPSIAGTVWRTVNA